jgi:prefoldin subunit 5
MSAKIIPLTEVSDNARKIP